MRHAPGILVVDDQAENLLILSDLLADDYIVHTAGHAKEAFEFFERGGQAELVLLDIVMPDIDGFEVLQRLKASPATREIPVIFLTGLGGAMDEARGLAMGALDFIHKPFSAPVVLARVGHHLALSRATKLLRSRNDDLEQLVRIRTAEVVRQSAELVKREQRLVSAQAATITAFCTLAEARDDETGNHILRTQSYVRRVAEELQGHPRFRRALDGEAIDLLFKSAPLHDIGKVAIPDAILLKPGKLTPDEWVTMKRHTNYGRNAIVEAERVLDGGEGSFLRVAREIAYSHHEKWNGSGYPEGLVGPAIPLSARIMAAADVYDALTTRRVYKAAIPHDESIAMMMRDRGTHFDPDVMDAVVAVADDFARIAHQFADDAAVHRAV